MTNEEWLCQLSTEEKSVWLDKCVACSEMRKGMRCFGNHCIETLDVIAWLKQERSEE
jgi:hypothetical protein